MRIGQDYWRRVASAAPVEDVREAILTGYLAGKPFWPYQPVPELPRPIDRILDFGCGLGRNVRYLRSVANHVVGFDLPEMIDRCGAEPLPDNVELTGDWQDVRQRRFDCVFACLVLQHIEPGELAGYLRDFAAMAPWMYILSRGRSDFGGGVFERIAETGAFTEGVVCNLVDHDPVTHGLRHCGTLPMGAVPADDRHYEVLLGTTLKRR